jgi:hypothetical protein
MAVLGLEQRLAPLLLTQPAVWSPWGIGVLTPCSYDEDEAEQFLYATKPSISQQKELRRSHSWGGLATFRQSARYDQLFDEQVVESNAGTDIQKHRRKSTTSTSSDISRKTSMFSEMAFSTDSDDSTEPSDRAKSSNSLIEPRARDCSNTTTRQVRNLPFSVTREELLQAVDETGFGDLYDFVYVPHKFKEHRNLGFAFINFVNVETAQKFSAMWHRSRIFMKDGIGQRFQTTKPLNITVAAVQGHAANTKKARGSKMTRVRNTCFQPLMFLEPSIIADKPPGVF